MASASTLSDHQRALRDRAVAASLDTKSRPFMEEQSLLIIDYPEARDKHSVIYDSDDAELLMADDLDLSEIRFIPDVAGFFLVGSGRIEVRVRTRSWMALQGIPGAELELSLGSEESLDEGEEEIVFERTPNRPHVEVHKGEVSLVLGPATERFRRVMAIGGGWNQAAYTLSVEGSKHSTTEDVVEVLTRLADAFFFDLDARYGVPIEIEPRRERVRVLRQETLKSPPEFPSNKYHPQPVALYRYGRSALGLPLLSFLAFYQALEFFFPIFTQEEITKRVRQALVSPRFDPNDEVSLLKVIGIVRPNRGISAGEREQLRSVIRRCLSIETIENFVNSSEHSRVYFCDKRQTIKNVAPLNMNGGADLRDQVADRIYDIRCRVVHTKSDGGDGAVELLLPSSKEARSIGPDIELVRVAAQEAIIAASSPLDPR